MKIDEEELKNKIKNKINDIIIKLSEKVLIKYYPINNFVLKMNELGQDCYFLISGKLSILKLTEYKNIKISYHDYFIYLKNLLNLNEIDLILQVLYTNKKFLDINTIEEISKLIKIYFSIILKKLLIQRTTGITMDEIESFFKIHNFTFEEFNLSKNDILDDISEIKAKGDSFDILLCNYFKNKIKISKDDILLIQSYKVFNYEREKKAPLVTLYKYEFFLYLYPGSFFGDYALENTIHRRNATIRTEEDCFICSLSNNYYFSLLSEENKKLKMLDLSFILNNFFFIHASPVIFSKYYYPMIKEVEKNKNDIIYKQNENNTSVFLIKEGEVKTEINANIIDLYNLIKIIIGIIYIKNNNFKVSLDFIMDLRKNYLNEKKMNNLEYIPLELKKKINFELFTSNGYECLGILEFFLKKNYMTTCTILSKKCILLEIKKEDLSKIVKNEREILPDYNKYVFTKLLALIKRLHYLRNNIINQFKYKSFNNLPKNNFDIKPNKYQNINTKRQKIKILNPERVKYFFNEKTFLEESKKNNNSLPFTDRNFLFKRNKNLSQKNVYSLAKVVMNNIQNKILNNDEKNKTIFRNKTKGIFGSNISLIKKKLISAVYKNKYIDKANLSFSETKKVLSKSNCDDIFKDKNKIQINNDIINTKKGCVPISLIKKKILKNFINKKGFDKLNIVKNIIFPSEDEKSFQGENSFNNKLLNNNEQKFIDIYDLSISKNKKSKYIKNLFLLSKDEKENSFGNRNEGENSFTKFNVSAQNIKLKDNSIILDSNKNKENEVVKSKKDVLNSSISDLPSFKKANKKINNLIIQMKKNYALRLGQKRFIFYRKSKKNQAIIEEKYNSNSSKQNNISQVIKDYYLKKKIEGYSSLVNPLNNTYINRQKTIVIKKNKSFKDFL